MNGTPFDRRENRGYGAFMRRPLISSLLVAAGVLAGAVGLVAPAQAMVRGQADPVHKAVGSFWASFNGEAPFFICTGTQVSAEYFVTAGHCVDYVVQYGGQAYVSFEQDLDDVSLANLIPATTILNPRYKEAKGTDLYQFDVSLLHLDSASDVPSTDYGKLPTLGQLDGMKAAGTLRQAKFTLSGYGTSSMVVDPTSGHGNPISFPDTGERLTGTLGFTALSGSVLHENQRANAGFAGAGYGDSGGPTFLEGTNTILGVTSTGDIPCYATNTSYRLDTKDARDFLGTYLLLP